MTATLLIAGALLAQAVPAAAPVGADIDRTDVAYAALAEGRNDAVIAQLHARADDDPAALINLGTAYARKGMRREAAACFTRALTSDDRYQLQLSDGTWMDSRRAARLALDELEKSGTLSMR